MSWIRVITTQGYETDINIYAIAALEQWPNWCVVHLIGGATITAQHTKEFIQSLVGQALDAYEGR